MNDFDLARVEQLVRVAAEVRGYPNLHAILQRVESELRDINAGLAKPAPAAALQPAAPPATGPVQQPAQQPAQSPHENSTQYKMELEKRSEEQLEHRQAAPQAPAAPTTPAEPPAGETVHRRI